MKREKLTDEERKQKQDSDAVADYDGEKSNRAKYVETVGDDYVDTPVRDNTLEGRMRNFWYHYKWHTVITVVVALFLFIGINQVKNKEDFDLSVMYAGPAVINGEIYTQVSDSLSQLLDTDVDGNGKKSVYLYPFTYMTDEQVKAEMAKWEAQGIHDVSFDKQSNEEAHTNFNNMVFTGECGVMFLDKSLFEQVRDAGGLVTLESVLGTTPEGALDEYGVTLANVDAWKFYTALHVMPEDTVLCLRGPSTVGGVFSSKKQAQRIFEANREFFVDVMTFELPEGFVAAED